MPSPVKNLRSRLGFTGSMGEGGTCTRTLPSVRVSGCRSVCGNGPKCFDSVRAGREGIADLTWVSSVGSVDLVGANALITQRSLVQIQPAHPGCRARAGPVARCRKKIHGRVSDPVDVGAAVSSAFPSGALLRPTAGMACPLRDRACDNQAMPGGETGPRHGQSGA